MTGIQQFLLAQLKQRGKWLKIFFSVLGILLVLNIFIRPHHPHFVLDAYPGFFAVFGLGVGYVMIFVMKKIIQPLIVRKEDYYHDI
ncbi:MAG: hypothetical protein DELT_02777 [Desulfovibrio sp.]